MDATTNLTGYDMFKIRQKEEAAANDLFRLKQMNASERLFGKTSKSEVFDEVEEVAAPKTVAKDTVSAKTRSGVALTYAEYSYDDYISEVFNFKSEGDEALCRDQEEFYSKRARMRRPLAAVRAEEKYLATGELEVREEPAVVKKASVAAKTEEVSLLDKILKKVDSKAQFKKGSKIFIVGYVIIVLIVALILIVTTTILPSADASAAVPEETVVSDDTVKPMALESEEEETNWFDKLCDSMSN